MCYLYVNIYVYIVYISYGAGRIAAINPTDVILVRVGDFYEAHGLSAVMLVEHGNLNAMGNWKVSLSLSLSLSLSGCLSV
jgi:hypothetical protein